MRALTFLLFCCLASPALGEEILVQDAAALRQALQHLKPGTRLKLAAGEYPGGHHVIGVDDLTIEAADPRQPPHFKGGSTAWQFSRCANLTLRNVRISGQTSNGLNLDDGGKLDSPVSGITIEQVEISDIGPKGNHDGIKCSGLTRLLIRDCTITGWGGQGIDFVGCRQSAITGCRLVGKEGFTASAGIQLKGGTQEVQVDRCHFINAGERPLNIGGSTGLEYFRPQGALQEASGIVVTNCTIEGSPCAAAFVGVEGAEFTGNTILYPTKWIFRILQETKAPGFRPCSYVTVKGNKVVFRRSQVQVDVNIGEGTAPETFQFEQNQWFAEDQPQASKPKLPVAETGGVYGSDPREKR